MLFFINVLKPLFWQMKNIIDNLYNTPFDNLTILFLNSNQITPIMNPKIAKIMKYSWRFAIGMILNSIVEVSFGKADAHMPAITEAILNVI